MSHQDRFEEEKEFSFKNLFVPLTTLKAIHWIIVIGFIVFGNTLFNEFVWDDLVLFYSVDTYRSISNIGYIFLDHSMPYYRPVPFAILATFYTLFADSVFWYHLFGIILHITNTILLYLLFKRFISINISFLLSLIFLVHPMQVESVSYISSIINPLSLFFGLSAMFIALKQNLNRFFKYCLISVLFLLGILTKELGFLFIVFIPLYMLVTLRNKIKKQELKYLSFSFFIALIPFTYLRFFITNVVSIENTYTPVPIMNASLYERFITLPKIIFYYIVTFVYPINLAISQHWIIKNINFQEFFLPLIIDVCFFGLLIGGIIFLKNNKEKLLIYLFFLIWFLLFWGIHWNIVYPLDMTVADRWFYLPIVGLLGVIGTVISEITIKNKFVRRVGIVTVAILIIFFSFRTTERNLNWKDPLTLYLHDIKISTESHDLETQLGEQLINHKRYAEAKPHLDKAVQLAPDFWSNWTVLGIYYTRTNQIDKAIYAFSTSIKNNSGNNLAYLFLADVYYNNRTPQETKEYLTQSLKKHPNEPYFIYLMGRINYKLGNKVVGMEEVSKAYNLRKDTMFLKTYSDMQQNKELD